MPKFKQPRLKQTTIRNGRICRTNISRPPFVNQQASISVPDCVTTDYIHAPVVEEPLQPEAKIPDTQQSKHGAEEGEAWEKIKKSLRTAFYEAIVPEQGGQLCVMCHQEPDIIITCRECSHTGHVFCRDCAIAMHKQHCLLHTIVEWENDHPSALSYQCTFSRESHDCSTCISTRSIKVFNDTGQLHTALIKYCDCEAPAATLVRFGLWPCSPQMPATAVSMELMDIIYCMMLEGQISLKAVCQAVGNHSCLDPSEVNLLYRCMVGECMEQFRFFRHKIKTLGDKDEVMKSKCME